MSQNNNDKTLGAVLKEARQAKNISLEEAGKHTRIHPNIIRSMESDDFKSLGTVYAKSFLKLYAEYLGLDKEVLLRRFEAEAGVPAVGPPRILQTAPKPKAVKVRRTPLETAGRFFTVLKKIPPKTVFISLVVLVVIFSLVKVRTYLKRAAKKPKAKTAEVKKVPVSKLAASAKTTAKTTSPRPAPVAPAKVQAVAKPPVAGKEQEKIVLVLRAKDKTWLQVKVDGKVVLQNILPKGAAESWQARDKIELWLGNAGAVQLELNGRLLEKIGRPGQTLRRVIVTREGLTIQK